MLDIAVSFNKYKFIGNEFLTWLWYLIENESEKLVDGKNHLVILEIGNKIVLENNVSEDSSEVITIKGDDADLKEGIIALKKGAVVTELHLVLRENELEWRFTIKGESFHYSGLKTPETGKIEKKEDIDGAILERSYLYGKVIDTIDDLFHTFIEIRISDQWAKEVVPQIKGWIA